MDNQKLISEYIDIGVDGQGPDDPANARLRGYGVPVWALVGQWQALNEDVDEVARDYDLPREAVDAALAYYRCYKTYIDARLLLNSA